MNVQKLLLPWEICKFQKIQIFILQISWKKIKAQDMHMVKNLVFHFITTGWTPKSWLQDKSSTRVN